MADQFLQNLKQCLSVADMDNTSPDLMCSFPGVNRGHQDIPGLNLLMGSFPPDSMFPMLSECPGGLETLPGFYIHQDGNTAPPATGPIDQHRDRKRKEMADIGLSGSSPDYSSAHSSPQVSNSGNGSKTSRASRGKRKKVEAEKPREVIHVRAKRGQATDSHSLAERVRRGKINERLRCLQDIVPGCYKTMGMAVMLDEIINYVQSLQNQVEFLSMKLTAASSFYDFNSDIDAIEIMQRAKANESMKVENVDSHELLLAQLAPLAPKFGCYPQLPHSR